MNHKVEASDLNDYRSTGFLVRHLLGLVRQMIGRGTLFLGMSLMPMLGHAASFDCSKASTWTEKTICASPRLSELDIELDKLYRDALTRTPDVGGARDEVRNIQRGWLRCAFQRSRTPVSR